MDSFSVTTNPKPAKLDKPFFYKEDSDAKAQMEALKEFSKTCPKGVKEKVDRDMKMLSYGIYGEDQVAYELKTSYLPIIVLHDIHIEYEGLSAQIDYLVITRKFTLVIESRISLEILKLPVKASLFERPNLAATTVKKQYTALLPRMLSIWR